MAVLPPEAMEPWAGEALMGKERSGVLEEQARVVAEEAKDPRGEQEEAREGLLGNLPSGGRQTVRASPITDKDVHTEHHTPSSYTLYLLSRSLWILC